MRGALRALLRPLARFVDEVVYAFLDCGDLDRGFARVFCDACRSEYLLAFSCSRRGF
ncbi:MAG: transposase zinc-binding domain-containing protein [Thermoanaerobaculia bacterium]